MSTILKALRRLEEDDSTETRRAADSGAERPSSTLPATDPRAADELRDRILAEEFAAQSTNDVETKRRRSNRISLAAAVASALLIGVGLGLYSISTAPTPENSPALASRTPTPGIAPATARAQAPAVAAPLIPQVAAAPSLDRPARVAITRPEEPTKLSAATARSGRPQSATSTSPTTLAAPIARTTPLASLPKPVIPTVVKPRTPTTLTVVTSDSVSDPIPKPKPKPKPKSAPKSAPKSKLKPKSMALAAVVPSPAVTSTSSPSKPKNRIKQSVTAQQTQPAPTNTSTQPVASGPRHESKPRVVVEEHVAVRPPNLKVLRTAWHPEPMRRSAKIRLTDTDETIILREGDAVGALVVQEISPSAIVFLSGEVEVRIRVGHPGSGG